jgi:peptide/nickel transport system substrate-binding protein
VVALDAEPQTVDPRFATDATASRISDLVHVGLTRNDASGRRVPSLASSWRFADPTTLIFTLRTDLRFADGTPVRASDVVATYEAVLDPALGSPKRAGLDMLAGVTAPDDATVVMRLRAPFAPFLDATGLGVVPAGRAHDPSEIREGAGPFRVVRVDRGERVVLAPNPAWPEPATIDPLEFRVVPDPLVRLLELRRGGVQLAQDTPEPELLEWLRAVPGLRVRRQPGTSFAYLALNLRDPRLARRRVREAIALALDRDRLLRAVLGDMARPASGLLAPEHWAFVAVPSTPFDPTRARRLLDRAGFPDPDGAGPAPRFRLLYKTSSVPARRRLAEALQAQLADVGIALDVRTYEWGTVYADVRAGRFEVAAMAWVGVGDPDLFYLTLHSTMTPPAGYNRGHYASTVMDRLVEQGRRALDVATRQRVYARVQRRAARDLPMIPLWWEDRVVIESTRLVDFEPQPSGDLLGLATARME